MSEKVDKKEGKDAKSKKKEAPEKAAPQATATPAAEPAPANEAATPAAEPAPATQAAAPAPAVEEEVKKPPKKRQVKRTRGGHRNISLPDDLLEELKIEMDIQHLCLTADTPRVQFVVRDFVLQMRRLRESGTVPA